MILILGDDIAACVAAHEIRKIKRREEVIIVRFSCDVAFSGYCVTIWDRTYVKLKILVAAWPSLNRGNTINLLRPGDADDLRETLQSAKEVTVIGGSQRYL